MKKIWDWYCNTAKIRTKLTISYLLLVLLPILVLGVYSYKISKDNLLEQTRGVLKENLSAITYSLNNNIQRENDNIKYLSYNAELREKLASGTEDSAGLAKTLNESVEPVFWYFIASDHYMKGIQIFSPYVSQSVGSFLKPLEGSGEEELYEKHKEDFKTHWSYQNGDIYVSRILLDANTSSQPIGIMKMEVFSEYFIDSVFKISYLQNGVVLTDQKNGVIGSRSARDTKLESQIRQVIADGVDSGSYETERYMLEASGELDNGWRLYYYIDKQEISGQINRILATTVLIMGVCLAFIMILIRLISVTLSSRILKLKKGAEEVSKGNFSINLNQDAKDEIGVVEKSFSQMCDRINHMLDEMYRLGMEKRAEELKALQAMINPHFLYNCLSSIKWKAIRAEQQEIGDITGLLAKFYRTTLNGGRQITVVKSEIENIKAYLELQLRAHDDKFDIEYVLQEEGQELEMPNFLLQPIVENAICHGVECCGKEERGYIRVEYQHKENYLIFNVYNNGPGLDKEEMEKMLMSPGKGYGLYNIRERIRIYYNEKCGVFSSITEEGLVCFTVKIKDKISKIPRGQNVSEL